MQVETHNVIWLDRTQSVSIHDLVDLSGLTESEVRELVDGGALAPMNPLETAWIFSADCVLTVRKASRLRDDLELDAHALAVALSLLAQIQSLEAELSQLRAQRSSTKRF